MSNIISDVKDISTFSKQVSFKIPREALDAEMDRAAKKLRPKVTIPGFRKGKAPVSLIKKRFNERLLNDALDTLFPQYFFAAKKEAGIDSIGNPQVTDMKEVDEGLELTVEIEHIAPNEAIKDFKVEFPPFSIEVTEQEIDDYIEKMALEYAEWEETNETITNNMRVEFVVLEEGEEGKPFKIVVGDKSVDEEFNLTLVGKKIGDIFEWKEGKKVAIKKVEKVKRFPSEEEVAAKLKLSVDQLRSRVKENLEHHKRRMRVQQRYNIVMKELIDRFNFEIPPKFLELLYKRRASEKIRYIESRGVQLTEEELDKLLEKELEAAKMEALRIVILETVAKTFGLEADKKSLSKIKVKMKGKEIPALALPEHDPTLEDIKLSVRQRKALVKLLDLPEEEIELLD